MEAYFLLHLGSLLLVLSALRLHLLCDDGCLLLNRGARVFGWVCHETWAPIWIHWSRINCVRKLFVEPECVLRSSRQAMVTVNVRACAFATTMSPQSVWQPLPYIPRHSRTFRCHLLYVSINSIAMHTLTYTYIHIIHINAWFPS